MHPATILSLALSFHGPAEQPDTQKEAEAKDAPAEAAEKGEEEKPEENAAEEKAEPAAEESAPAEATTEKAEAAPAETTAEASVGVGASAEAKAPEPAAEEPPPATEPPPAEAKPKHELQLSPGVHAFLRGQGLINRQLDSDTQDLGQVLNRVRIQLHGKYGPIAAFAQVQDAREWGFEDSTVANMGNTDLHQGWFELRGAKEDKKLLGFIRAGRQKIVWGNQRLIGGLEWMPNARSFDALRLVGKVSMVEADAFLAIMQPMGDFTYDDDGDPMTPPVTAANDGSQLMGLRVAVTPHKAINAEVVGLFDHADPTPTAPTLDRKVGNAGLRLWGEPLDGLTYGAEGNYQFGSISDADHRAWAWVAEAGYMHKKKRVKPGGHVKYAMASGHACTGDPTMGEACAQDGDSKDFFNFYHTNHIHYGLVDLQNWSNMRDLEVAFKLGFDKLFVATVAYHFFQLQEEAGRWTDAPGRLVGAGWNPANDSKNLGNEIDVFITFKPFKQLMVQPGYGVFLPMEAGENIAGNDPYHFAFLWLMATFDALGK